MIFACCRCHFSPDFAGQVCLPDVVAAQSSAETQAQRYVVPVTSPSREASARVSSSVRWGSVSQNHGRHAVAVEVELLAH